MEVYIKHVATEDLPFWDSYCVLGNGPRLVCPNPPPPVIHVQPLNMIKKSHPKRLFRNINKDPPEKDFADEPKGIKTPTEIVVEEVIEGIVIIKKFIEIEVKHFKTEDSSFDSVSPSSADGHTDTDSEYDLTEEENKELINEMKFRLEELLGIPNESRSKVLMSAGPSSAAEVDTLPVFTESSVSNGNVSAAIESLSDEVFEADSDMLASDKDMTVQNCDLKQKDANDVEDVNNDRKFSLTSAKSIDSIITNQTVSSEGSSFALWTLFGSENSLDRIEHFIHLTKSDSFDYKKGGKAHSLDADDGDPNAGNSTDSTGNKLFMENVGKETDNNYNQGKKSSFTNDAGSNLTDRLNVDDLGVTNEDSDDSISVSVDLEICVRVSLNEDATVQKDLMGSPVDDFGNGSNTGTLVTDPCVLIARDIVEKVLEASRPLVAQSTDRALKDRREKPSMVCAIDKTDVQSGVDGRRCIGACNELEQREADVDIDESQSEGFFEQSADWDGQSDVYIIHNDISSHASMERIPDEERLDGIPDEEQPHDMSEKLREGYDESCKDDMNDMCTLSKSNDSVVDFENFQKDLFEQTEMTSEGNLVHSSNVNIHDSLFEGDHNDAHMYDTIEETDNNCHHIMYDDPGMCDAVCTNNAGIGVLSTVIEESEVNSTIDSTTVRCEYLDNNGDVNAVKCSGTSPGLSVTVRHQTFKYDEDVEVLAVMIDRDCEGKCDTNECSVDEVEKILNDLIEDITMNVGEGSDDPSAMAIIIDDQNGFDNPAVEYIELQDPDDCNVNELLNDMLEKVKRDLSSETESDDNSSHPVALIIDEVSFQAGNQGQLARITDVRPHEDMDVIIVAKQESEESDIGLDDSRCLDSSEDYITCVSSEEDYNYPATGNENNEDEQDTREKTEDDTHRDCMGTSFNRELINKSNDVLKYDLYDSTIADNDSEILMTDYENDPVLNNIIRDETTTDVIVDVAREGTNSVLFDECKLENELDNLNDDLAKDESCLSEKRESNVSNCLPKTHLSKVFGQVECLTKEVVITTEDGGECNISETKMNENDAITKFISAQKNEVQYDNDIFGEKEEISVKGFGETSDINVSSKHCDESQEIAKVDVILLVSVEETANMSLNSDECHGYSEIQDENKMDDIIHKKGENGEIKPEYPNGTKETSSVESVDINKDEDANKDVTEHEGSFKGKTLENIEENKNIKTVDEEIDEKRCTKNDVSVKKTDKENSVTNVNAHEVECKYLNAEVDRHGDNEVNLMGVNIRNNDENAKGKGNEDIHLIVDDTVNIDTNITVGEIVNNIANVNVDGIDNIDANFNTNGIENTISAVENAKNYADHKVDEIVNIDEDGKVDAIDKVGAKIGIAKINDIFSNIEVHEKENIGIAAYVNEQSVVKVDKIYKNDTNIEAYELETTNVKDCGTDNDYIDVKIYGFEYNSANENVDKIEDSDKYSNVEKIVDNNTSGKVVEIGGNSAEIKVGETKDFDYVKGADFLYDDTGAKVNEIESNYTDTKDNGFVNDKLYQIDTSGNVGEIVDSNANIKVDEIENNLRDVKVDAIDNGCPNVNNDAIENNNSDSNVNGMKKTNEDGKLNAIWNNEAGEKAEENVNFGPEAVDLENNDTTDVRFDEIEKSDGSVNVDRQDWKVALIDEGIAVNDIEDKNADGKVKDFVSNDLAEKNGTDVKMDRIMNNGVDVNAKEMDTQYDIEKVVETNNYDTNVEVETLAKYHAGGNVKEIKIDDIENNYEDDSAGEIWDSNTDVKTDGLENNYNSVKDFENGNKDTEVIVEDSAYNVKVGIIESSDANTRVDTNEAAGTIYKVDKILINEACVKGNETMDYDADVNVDEGKNNNTDVKINETLITDVENHKIGNSDSNIKMAEFQEHNVDGEVDENVKNHANIEENVHEINRTVVNNDEIVNTNIYFEVGGIESNDINIKDSEIKIKDMDVNFDDITNDRDIRVNEIENKSTDEEEISKNDEIESNNANFNVNELENNTFLGQNEEIVNNDANIEVGVNENDRIKVDEIEDKMENKNIDEIANIKADVNEIDLDSKKVDDFEKKVNLIEEKHDFTPEIAGGEVSKYTQCTKHNSASSNVKMMDSTFIFSCQKLIIVISEEVTNSTIPDESSSETKISIKEDGGWHFVKTVHNEDKDEVYHEKEDKKNDQQSEIHQSASKTSATEAVSANDKTGECRSNTHQVEDSVDTSNATSVEWDVDKKVGNLQGKELLVVDETQKVDNSYEKFNLAAIDTHKQETASDVSVKVESESGSPRDDLSNTEESETVSFKIGDINKEHDIGEEDHRNLLRRMTSVDEFGNDYGTQNENSGRVINDVEETLKNFHATDKTDDITIADEVPVYDVILGEKDKVNYFTKKNESNSFSDYKCSSKVVLEDDQPPNNGNIDSSVQMDCNPNADMMQKTSNERQNAISMTMEHSKQILERAETKEINEDINIDADELLPENLCDKNGDKMSNEFGNTINAVDIMVTVINITENLAGNNESEFIDNGHVSDESEGICLESNIDSFVEQTEIDNLHINEKIDLTEDVKCNIPTDSSDKNHGAKELKDIATIDDAACENANPDTLDNENKDKLISDETSQLVTDGENNEIKKEADECGLDTHFKTKRFENKKETCDDISDVRKSDKIGVVVSRRRSYDKNTCLEQAMVAFSEPSDMQNEDGITDKPCSDTGISDDKVEINFGKNDSKHTEENVGKKSQLPESQNENMCDDQETNFVGNIKPDDQIKLERSVDGHDVQHNIVTEAPSCLPSAEEHVQTCGKIDRSINRVCKDEAETMVNTMSTVKNKADDLETDTISAITVWNSSKPGLSRHNTNKLRRGKSFIGSDVNVKSMGLQRKPSLSQIKVYKAVEMNSEDDSLLPESHPDLVEVTEDTMDTSMKKCVTSGEAIVEGIHSSLDKGTFETYVLDETKLFKELPETNSKVLLPQNAIDQDIHGEAGSGICSEYGPAEESVNDQSEQAAHNASGYAKKGVIDDEIRPEESLVDGPVDSCPTDMECMVSTNVDNEVDLDQTMEENMNIGNAENKDNLCPTDKVNLSPQEDGDIVKPKSQVCCQGYSENTEENYHYCEKNTQDKIESYSDSESFMVTGNGITISESEEKNSSFCEKDEIPLPSNEPIDQNLPQSPITESNIPSSNENLHFEYVKQADSDLAENDNVTLGVHSECLNERLLQNFQESVQDIEYSSAINISGNADEEAKENVQEHNLVKSYKFNDVDNMPVSDQETTIKDMSNVSCVEIKDTDVTNDTILNEIGCDLVENENEVASDVHYENIVTVKDDISQIADEKNADTMVEDVMEGASLLDKTESSAKLDGGTTEIVDKLCDAIDTDKNKIEANNTEGAPTQNDNESNIIVSVGTVSNIEQKNEHGKEQMSIEFSGEMYQIVDAVESETDASPEKNTDAICVTIHEDSLSENKDLESILHGTGDSQCDNADAIETNVEHIIEEDKCEIGNNNVEVIHDGNKVIDDKTELMFSYIRDNSQETSTSKVLGTDSEVKYDVNEINSTADKTPDEIRYHGEQSENELKEILSMQVVPDNENITCDEKVTGVFPKDTVDPTMVLPTTATDSVDIQCYKTAGKGKDIEINETSSDHRTDDEPMAKNNYDEDVVESASDVEINNYCKEEDSINDVTSSVKKYSETNKYQDTNNQDQSVISKFTNVEVNIKQSAEKPHDDNTSICKATDEEYASKYSPALMETPVNTESSEITSNSEKEPTNLQTTAENPYNTDYAEIKSSSEPESNDIPLQENLSNTGRIEYENSAEQALNDIPPQKHLDNTDCTETMKDTENVLTDIPSDKRPDNMKHTKIKNHTDQLSISQENKECIERDNAEYASVEVQPFIECPEKSDIINNTEHMLNDKNLGHEYATNTEAQYDKTKEGTKHSKEDFSFSNVNKESDEGMNNTEIAPNDLSNVDIANTEYDSVTNDTLPKEDTGNTEKKDSPVNDPTEHALHKIPPANENPIYTETDCSVINCTYIHASNDTKPTEEGPSIKACTDFAYNTNQASTEVPLAEGSASTGAEIRETDQVCEMKDDISSSPNMTTENTDCFNESKDNITIPPSDNDKVPDDVNNANNLDISCNLTNTQSLMQREVTYEMSMAGNEVNKQKSKSIADSQTYHRNTFEVVADVHYSMDMDEQRPNVASTKHSSGKVNDVVKIESGRNSNLIESRHKNRESEINVVGLDQERGVQHVSKSTDAPPLEKANDELQFDKHKSVINSSTGKKKAIENCTDDIKQLNKVNDLPKDKMNFNHDENQSQKPLSPNPSLQQDLRSRSLSDVIAKTRVPPDGTEGTLGMKNRTASLGNLTKYKTLTEFECRKQFFETRGRVSGESQDHSAGEHFREKGNPAFDHNVDTGALQEEDRNNYQGFQSDNYRRSIDHAHIKDMNEMTAVDIDLNESDYDEEIGCVDADVLSNRLKKWLADRRRSSLQGETERFIKEAFPDDICPTPRRLHRLCEHIKKEAKKKDMFIKQRNESLDSSGQVRDLTLRRYGSAQRSMECLDRDVTMARRSREGSRHPSIERRSSRGSISPLESPHNSPYQSLEDLRYKCRKPDFIEVRKLNNESRNKKADFLMNVHLKTFAKPKPVVNEKHGPFELIKVRKGLPRDENFDRQHASAKRRGLYPQVKVSDQARQIEYEVYRYDREFRQNENRNIRAYVESQYLNTNQIYHQSKSSRHGNLRERYDETQITNKQSRITDTTTTALYDQPITDQYQKNRCANKQAPTLTTKVVTLSSNQDNGLQLYRSNLEQVHDRNKLQQHLLGHRDPTGPNGPKGLQKMRIPLDRENTPKDGPLSLADSFTAMDRSHSHDSQSTVGSHSYSNAGSHSNTGSHHSHAGSHNIKHAIASKLDSHDSSSPNLSHASKLSGNHILSGNNLSAHHMSGNSLSQELASKLDIAESSTHSLAGQINNRLSTHRSSSSGHNMSGQNLSQELASKLDIADSSTHSLAGQINNRLSANNMSGQHLSQELASKLDIADSSGHSLDRLQNLSTHSVGKESLSHELAAKLDIHSSSQNLSGKLSDSQTSLSSRHAPSRSPSRQNTLQKQHSVQSSMSEINGERKDSYVGGIKFERLKNLEEDELLVKIREIIGHLERLEDYHRGDGMRIQKMLGDMYWDYTHMREMIADCMAENGYAVVAMKMLKTLNSIGIFKNDDVWFPTYYTYNTMWNFSDASPILAKKLSENDAVRLLTLNCGHKPYINALHSKNVFYVIKASLSILHNIARNSGMKHLFDENKTSETVMPFIESEDEMLKILASLTIANIVDEEENKTIIVETRTIHNIVGWIDKAINLPRRRYKGFTPQELTEGLNKLAVNDSNKMKIVEEGGIPLILKMLQNEDVREQSSAGRIIWTLSFDKDVRETFLANSDLISTLEKLVESTNKSVQQNASGSLWIIKGENDISRETRPKPPATKSHVFLSYSWSDKDEVLELRDKLRAEGYAIWIDIEKDSTLDGMAHAVEHSAVVLVCMSEKYKHNPNCRTEAEYTFQMKKEYIPLMMQKKYRPDGWLGVILGAKLYFDFSGKYPFEKSFTGLLKELRGRGKVTPNNTPNGNDVSDGGMQSHMLALTGGSFQSPGTAVPSNSIIMNMGQEELIKWLRNVKLTECIPAFLEFDGRLLMQLKQMRVEAPEFFYQCLEKRLNMSLIEILKFTRALEELH